MTVTAPNTGRDARVIGLIGSGHFMSHFYIFALPPLFPILKQEMGFGYTSLGLILTAFHAASGAAQLPIGFVVDRVGARAILIAGLVLGALAFIVMGVSGSYTALIVCAIVAGAANSVYHPADYSILSHAVGSERMGRAFSLHTFSGYAGGAAAPPAMVAIASFWSWQAALITAGIVGLIVAAVLVLGAGDLVDRGGERADEKPAAATAKAGIGLLLTPPILLCFLFFTLLAMSAGGINSFAVAAFVDSFDVTLPVATAALTAFLVGSAVGILAGGVIADRTQHHERVAMAGFGATAAIVLLVGNVAMPAVLLTVAMGAGGLLFGMIMPSRDMLVRRVTPPGSMGKVFAFVSVGLSLGGVVTPALFGWIMDWGNPRWLFWLAASFMLLALLTAFATRTTHR